MTPEETERKLAEKVMGWRISAPWGEDGLKSYIDKNDKPVMLVSNWHPRSDLNQLMMCVEKMRGTVMFGFYKEELGVIWANGKVATSFNKDPKFAIAEAILKAIEGDEK